MFWIISASAEKQFQFLNIGAAVFDLFLSEYIFIWPKICLVYSNSVFRCSHKNFIHKMFLDEVSVSDSFYISFLFWNLF